MANIYYPGSRIPQKKLERIIAAFIDGKTVAAVARSENLEENSVRGIFTKICRRLEEDCWRRLKKYHHRMKFFDFPHQVLRRDVRYRNFQMSGDTSLYIAAPVAVFFMNGTIATNIILINRARLNSSLFPIDIPAGMTRKDWDFRIMGCLFADLNFEPRGTFILKDYQWAERFMIGFWHFLRSNTGQKHKGDSEKYYYHMKELEWRFNNMYLIQRKDIIEQLIKVPCINLKEVSRRRMARILRENGKDAFELVKKVMIILSHSSADAPENQSSYPNINEKLTLTALALLKEFPLSNLSSIDEDQIFF